MPDARWQGSPHIRTFPDLEASIDRISFAKQETIAVVDCGEIRGIDFEHALGGRARKVARKNRLAVRPPDGMARDLGGG